MDRSNSFIRLWAQLLSPVLLFAIPWSEACQTPLSVGFPQQEYWSGLSFLSDLGIESASPILASRLFASEPRGKPSFSCQKSYIPFPISLPLSLSPVVGYIKNNITSWEVFFSNMPSNFYDLFISRALCLMKVIFYHLVILMFAGTSGSTSV